MNLAEMCFRSWCVGINDTFGTAKFSSKDGLRREHIKNLFDMWLDYKVPQDEAASYCRKVVEFLVTREGIKGKGKYRDWAPNAEKDFKDVLADAYLPSIPKPEVLKLGDIYMSSDSFGHIRLWSENKYGKENEVAYIASKTLGGALWTMFVKETYKVKDTNI